MDILAGLDGDRHVPARACVAGVGIEVQRADPVIARGKSSDRGVAFQIGIHFGGHVFRLATSGAILCTRFLRLLSSRAHFRCGFMASISSSIPEMVMRFAMMNFFRASR